MLAVPVEDLPLGTRYQACCKRANLKDGTQILVASAADTRQLENLLGIDGVKDVRRAAAVAQAPPCISLLELCRQESIVAAAVEQANGEGETSAGDEAGNDERSIDTTFSGINCEDEADVYCSMSTLPVGDQALDDLLGGGLHAGQLTEIVGQSATGKTQLALQSALYAALALEVLPTEEEAKEIVQLPFTHEADTFTALRGIGIKDAKSRVNVAFLTPEGDGEAQRMTRRLLEMCDAVIAERWYMATDVEHALASQHSDVTSQQVRQRRGRFADDERPRYGLEETLQIARKQVLDNIHFASYGDYESFEHALTYGLPGLATSLARRRRGRIGLIVVDDLPAVVNEELEASTSSRMQSAVARSRLVCDLADRLKRAATLCGRAASPSKYALTIPATVLAVNHVVDASDREKELLAPIIGDVLDGRLSITEGFDTQATFEEPPLSAVLQELHFSGILAHVDPTSISSAVAQAWRLRQERDEAQRANISSDTRHDNRLAPTREEIIAGILSDLRVAALGYAWVNGINARLALTKSAKTVSIPKRILWPRDKRKKRKAPDEEAEDEEDAVNDSRTPLIDLRTLEASRRTRRALRIGIRRAVAVLHPSAPTAQGIGKNAAVDVVILPAGVRALTALPPSVAQSARIGGERNSHESSVDSDYLTSSSSVPVSTLPSAAALDEDAADEGDIYGGDADLWNTIDDLSSLGDVELSQVLAQHENSTDSDLVSLSRA